MQPIKNTLTYCIAFVWVINGLVCKVMHLVPRHEQIVAKILGAGYATPFTIIIGILEIGMAIWILSGYKTKLNALTQIAIIVTMNTLEFFLAPELLLWGKLNSLFAFLFIVIIYYNEFHLRIKHIQPA